VLLILLAAVQRVFARLKRRGNQTTASRLRTWYTSGVMTRPAEHESLPLFSTRYGHERIATPMALSRKRCRFCKKGPDTFSMTLCADPRLSGRKRAMARMTSMRCAGRFQAVTVTTRSTARRPPFAGLGSGHRIDWRTQERHRSENGPRKTQERALARFFKT
jgi:hypothetical protein